MIPMPSTARQLSFPRLKSLLLNNPLANIARKTSVLIGFIRSVGFHQQMEELEKSKLGIFNHLCLLQLIAGFLFPFYSAVVNPGVPAADWWISLLPAIILVFVLFMNHRQRFEAAFYGYFLFYPLMICVVYLNRIDLGIELSFVLCGILSVFFMRDTWQMIFAISFSMISYFVLFLIKRQSTFPPVPLNDMIYLLNEVLTIIFIFYALFLIMKENMGYQYRLKRTNQNLHTKNLKIEKQQIEIQGIAFLLQKQAEELRELDRVKNKMFSIVSHDLKAPMYALRNLFQQLAEKGYSAQEMEGLLPEIQNDLHYSTGLVENLLEWARSQMSATASTHPTYVDINRLVEDTVQQLMPQIRSKQITIEQQKDETVIAWADEQMIRLVFRNLLSKAIKFSPEKGKITVGTSDMISSVEVFVKDSGPGITAEQMSRINENAFYTTKGSRNESGTGLGLMLCREFLNKNESRLHIESEQGEGSMFSFALKN